MTARDLTFAELLAELERRGADPDTTTFEVRGDRVLHGDEHYDVFREDGTVVVMFL